MDEIGKQLGAKIAEIVGQTHPALVTVAFFVYVAYRCYTTWVADRQTRIVQATMRSLLQTIHDDLHAMTLKLETLLAELKFGR